MGQWAGGGGIEIGNFLGEDNFFVGERCFISLVGFSAGPNLGVCKEFNGIRKKIIV